MNTFHTQTIEQSGRYWPFENPGMIGKEEPWETGITIFQYMSIYVYNVNGREKNAIPITTLKNTEKVPNTDTDLNV